MAVPSTRDGTRQNSVLPPPQGQCASGPPFPLRLRQEKLDALYASSFSDEEMNREELLDELQCCLAEFADNNRKMQAAVKELQANARWAVEQAKEMRRLLDHPL